MNSLHRLERVLASSSLESPRPVTSLEVPLGLDQRITPKLLHRLKPAAVLVLVIRRPDGPTILFTERSSDLRSHSGQISFPGGRCDAADADQTATALREAEEEIGLDRHLPQVIGFLDDYPTVTGYLVTPVVALLQDPLEFSANPKEVAEIFEVPLDYLLDSRNMRRPKRIRWGLPVPYYEIYWQDWRIWGATAGMLKNLNDKLR